MSCDGKVASFCGGCSLKFASGITVGGGWKVEVRLCFCLVSYMCFIDAQACFLLTLVD